MENKTKTNKHWLVLLIACGMAGSSLGINMNVIGVFYQPVAADLNLLVGTFAFHSTLAAISLSFIALFVPNFLDTVKVKKLVLLGVLAASLSTVGMAFTSQTWMFYLLGILRGLGSGLFGPITITILINNWFDEKNSLVLSIAMSFAGIVGMLMSPVFTWTIGAFGWQFSFIFMGLCMALFNLPALLISFELYPKDEGLSAYGAKEISAAEDRARSRTTGLKKISYIALPFVTLSAIALLHSYATGVIQNLPGFAVSINFTPAFGATLLSAAMLGNISFKVLLGLTGEKIGIVMNILISLGLTLVALIVIIFIRQPYILAAFSFIFGAAYYIPGIGLPLLTNHFYGKQTSNRIYPIVAFIAGVGAAVSMSLVGFIFDFTGSFLSAFWLSVIFTIICVALLFVSSRKHKTEEAQL